MTEFDLTVEWAARVMADYSQVVRSRELPEPSDFYAPVVNRFRMNPRRTDDPVLNRLLEIARADDVWLDVGAGGGRYALPLALRVAEVVAIDPSPSMLAALEADAGAEGITNVRKLAARWPMDDPPTGDVGLMAHVGYDIEQIAPFLDQLEAESRRLCVAVMGESAMTTVASMFWLDVHQEPRIELPAMPELVALLGVRGRAAALHWVERAVPMYGSVDEALAIGRRQLWLREGSAKDQKFVALARERLIERDGRFTWDDQASRIGIAWWTPR